MYGAILDREPVRVILVTALFLGVATRESRYVRVTAPIVKRWIALWMHARGGELPVPKTVCDGCHNLSESTPMTSYLLALLNLFGESRHVDHTQWRDWKGVGVEQSDVASLLLRKQRGCHTTTVLGVAEAPSRIVGRKER